MLVLDEPSFGCGPVIVGAAFAALVEVDTTVPIVLVEKNTPSALALCSRTSVLVNGIGGTGR